MVDPCKGSTNVPCLDAPAGAVPRAHRGFGRTSPTTLSAGKVAPNLVPLVAPDGRTVRLAVVKVASKTVVTV